MRRLREERLYVRIQLRDSENSEEERLMKSYLMRRRPAETQVSREIVGGGVERQQPGNGLCSEDLLYVYHIVEWDSVGNGHDEPNFCFDCVQHRSSELMRRNINDRCIASGYRLRVDAVLKYGEV